VLGGFGDKLSDAGMEKKVATKERGEPGQPSMGRAQNRWGCWKFSDSYRERRSEEAGNSQGRASARSNHDRQTERDPRRLE